MGRVIQFFCSLRLTVFLLVAGLLLVFLGTLAQVDEGLYAAQARYFRSWYIWRPTLYHYRIPMLFPGGSLIGGLLIFNLVAAHIKRFRFTTSKIGIHLTHGGLILLLLGQLLTDMLSRESFMELPEGASSNYSVDFRANELVFANVSDPAAETLISIPEHKLVAGTTIENPSLPVSVKVLNYWPNCELSPPGGIAVAATAGLYTNYEVIPFSSIEENQMESHMAVLAEVFTDKQSFGSFLVTPLTQDSIEQIINVDGKQYSIGCMFAPMFGGNILAISLVGDMGGKSMVTFAQAVLAKKGELTKPNLPFKLKVKEMWPNCRVLPQPGSTSVAPKITQGDSKGYFVTPTELVTDTEHRNLPGAVVELIRSGKSLGTWLLWTGFKDPTVDLDGLGKPYTMAFQFKRYYEPYRIGLIKFSHERYKGTDTPSNFSSRLRVINPASNEDRAVEIHMNSPLRYKGMTFYQAGFKGEDQTILQVVKNPSWLTPYFACIMVGLGLIYQFGSHLLKFATKRKNA